MVKQFDLEILVKDWYFASFPTDELGEEINNRITFGDILNCLLEHNAVYDVIGVEDSIIRERIFHAISYILRIDYEGIYNLWLESA